MNKLKMLIVVTLLLCTFGCENNSFQDSARDYYGFQDIEYSWAYDVTDYTKVINNAQRILKVKIVEINDGTFKYATNNNSRPLTPIKVEVLDVLYGEEEDKDIKEIYQIGGDVTIEQMKNYYPIEKIKKMGLDKVSDSDSKTKYISYRSESLANLEVNQVYVVNLVNGSFDEALVISPDGYGVFKLNESTTLSLNSNETYTNVITNKIINVNDFKK